MGVIDPAAASTEEFGSGLRAHLARRDEPIEPAEAPAPARVVTEPRRAEGGPTRFDLDLIAAELEERTARLARREDELQAREARVAEEVAALNAAARIEAPESVPAVAEAETHQPAGDALRERLEQRIDILWRTFEDSLEATHPDGTPDYRTRLDAARMLLGAAYPTDAALGSTPAADEERLEDELARLRDRRLEWGKTS
jgi:hypothetical protein